MTTQLGPKVPIRGTVRGVLHDEIHNGLVIICSYHTPDASPAADNASIEVLIVVGAIDTRITLITAAGGHSDLQMYRNTTVSDNGTETITANMNQTSVYVPDTRVYHTPTVTNDGFLMLDAYVSSVLGGQFALRDDTEFVLQPNTNYLIRLINRAGSSQPLGIVVQHYQERRVR